MKFATKLALLFSGIFLILCVFITHIVTSSSNEILERTIKDQMEARAVGRMDKIDKVIFERLMDLKMLASEPLFKLKSPSLELIAERLEELAKSSGSYTSLSFFDMSRKRIVDSSGHDVGKTHTRNECWPEIESGKDSVIDMYYSESLKIPVFHIAVVVKDKSGARMGVLVGRLSAEWLSETLKFPATIQAFDKALNEKKLLRMDAVNKNGLIIYSNYHRNSILKNTSTYWKYIKDDVERGVMNKGYRLRLPGMEEEVVTFGHERGYQDYKGNGWTLIIHVPSEVVFAPATELRNRLITYMTAIGGFSVLTILLFARTISTPLRKLSVAAGEIGKGNLDVRVKIDSNDEVAELAKNLNAMASNLSLSNQALRRSEESHRELFENAKDFVYTTDLDGIFTSVNRALCERCGHRAEELVGAPIGKIVPPESLEKARKMTEVKQKGERPNTQYEMEIIAKNGEVIQIELNSRLIIENGKPMGVQGIGRDIGERKRREKEITFEMHELRDIVESNTDIFYVHNIEGKLVKWNKAVEEFTGFPPQELLLKSALDFICEEDKALGYQGMKEVFEKGHGMLEARLHRRDGVLVPYMCNGYVVRDMNGTVTGFAGTGRDITEHKMAEEKLKALKDAAEAATLLKDKFVTLVSHDLKGPLSTMLGFLKLLNRDMEAAKMGEKLLLESAITSGENMASLISDILNVSRLKNGKISPKLVFTDACFLSVKVISVLAAEAEQKGITLVNRLPRKTRIYADPELLGQVLQNLVSNAVKFCNSGGRVTIFMPDGEPSTIAVSDTGVGISPERIEKLFKYEEKTSTTGTAGEVGTGFGLPLSNEIVIAHGGRLTVESTPGAGSTFCIQLPFVRPRILIVDDDPLTRSLIWKYLSSLDLEFFCAEDGKEALGIVEKSAPHLIMTDLNMPVMDGFALLERLKRNSATKHLPVIVITSESGLESRERALGLGADDFIGKDMDINEFILRVKKVL